MQVKLKSLKKSHPLLNKISYFQFDNLVKNRVPFTLLNLGPSLVPLYSSVYKAHLENQEILTDVLHHDQVLSEKKVPKDGALVLICEDGQKSSKLFIDLEKKAYTNVYLVDGGYQQLMTKRSEA